MIILRIAAEKFKDGSREGQEWQLRRSRCQKRRSRMAAIRSKFAAKKIKDGS
jgi:hypothetical protein